MDFEDAILRAGVSEREHNVETNVRRWLAGGMSKVDSSGALIEQATNAVGIGERSGRLTHFTEL